MRLDPSWRAIVNAVLKLPKGVNVSISKRGLPHPRDCGFVRTLGSPKGQRADWELILPDGRRVHVLEFEDTYLIHWDEVSPLVDPINHLRKDAPKWYVLYKVVSTILKLRFKIR